jgi:hypothetical protein
VCSPGLPSAVGLYNSVTSVLGLPLSEQTVSGAVSRVVSAPSFLLVQSAPSYGACSFPLRPISTPSLLPLGAAPLALGCKLLVYFGACSSPLRPVSTPSFLPLGAAPLALSCRLLVYFGACSSLLRPVSTPSL